MIQNKELEELYQNLNKKLLPIKLNGGLDWKLRGKLNRELNWELRELDNL